MPLYEFECQDCHFRFETLVRSAAAISEVTCAKCHGARLNKLISTTNPGTVSGKTTLPASGSGCSAKSPFR